MAETVTLLEHRVRQVVDRLRGMDAERRRLARELESLRDESARLGGGHEVVAQAAETLERLARELDPGEDA